MLTGSYRDALRFHLGEKITFDSDAFVISRSPSMKPFLENLLQLQTFQQFIAERLDLLNAGQGFMDEFEIETNLWADKWKTDSRYKDWLQNMKVGTCVVKQKYIAHVHMLILFVIYLFVVTRHAITCIYDTCSLMCGIFIKLFIGVLLKKTLSSVISLQTLVAA